MDAPKTLLEAVTYFSDFDRCREFMVLLRWPDGVCCPECGSERVTWLARQRRWKCREKHARQQFTLKTGTIFEDSPLPLSKWLPAVWLIVNAKNGISSYELGRAIGVTQKSAWYMGHRIRLALHTGSFERLAGEVEVDETFIGGNARNVHTAQRKRRISGGRGLSDKTIVLGMLERGGGVVQRRTKKALQPPIQGEGSGRLRALLRRADVLPRARQLYAQKVINHAVKYVYGNVHTNGMENFWAPLKRALGGT